MHEESDAGGAGKSLLTYLRYEVQDNNADLTKLLTDFVIQWRPMDVLILSGVHLHSPVALMAFEAFMRMSTVSAVSRVLKR